MYIPTHRHTLLHHNIERALLRRKGAYAACMMKICVCLCEYIYIYI